MTEHEESQSHGFQLLPPDGHTVTEQLVIRWNENDRVPNAMLNTLYREDWELADVRKEEHAEIIQDPGHVLPVDVSVNVAIFERKAEEE